MADIRANERQNVYALWSTFTASAATEPNQPKKSYNNIWMMYIIIIEWPKIKLKYVKTIDM